MKPFSKSEFRGVLIILTVLFVVTLLEMRTSVRRARDAQRRADIGNISNALNKFLDEFGYFPPSEDGKIKMCKKDNFEEVMSQVRKREQFDRDLFFEGLRPCDWGKDELSDVMDEGYEPYLKVIPSDPLRDDGLTYIYLSNTKRYQIFTYLEGETEETGFDEGIVARNLSCGKGICSFGRHYASPLVKRIEEYEEELRKKGV